MSATPTKPRVLFFLGTAPHSLFGNVSVVVLVRCRTMVLPEKMKNPFSIRCSSQAQMFKHGCFSKSFYSDRCNLILDSGNVSVHWLSNPAFQSTGAKEPTDMRAPAERLPAPPELCCGRGAHWNWHPKLSTASCSVSLLWMWWCQSGTHHLKEALLGLELFPLCL